MPEAAIAEPPVETPTPAAPPAAHPGAVTIDLGNLSKKPAPAKAEPTDAEKATANEAALAAKAAADVKAAEAKPAETPPPVKPNDKEHNMAELRKAREAAETARKALEEEHIKLKNEFEALKTKAPELPEDIKSKLAEMEELRKTVRQTDLARDPEFQAKYNKPIMDRLGVMGSTVIAAGVPEADWKNAVSNWNEDQFAEWQESMTPIQKVKFNAAWTAAVDLYQQQQTELKNADTTYQEMLKKRQSEHETQQQQYFSQNEQLARSVMAEVLKPDSLKEYEDLPAATEALLMKAARHEIPAKDIFTQIAANQVLSRTTMKQAKQIEELQAQLAERDKKISDLDTFVANSAAGVPRGDAAGSSGAAKGDNTPLWKQIVIK